MTQLPRGTEKRWTDRLSRSVFFFGALLFHLMLFIMVATWIVFQAPPREPEELVIFMPKKTEPPVTPPVPSPGAAGFSSWTANAGTSVMPVIPPTPHKIDISIHEPKLGGVDAGAGTPKSWIEPSAPPEPNDLLERLPGIRDTVENKWHHDPKEGTPKSEFVICVAAYANGDWDCNTRLDKDGNIVAGSIPNLIAKIKEWSHGEMKGEVVPKPLNIGGPELNDKMPPFVFFTGHKDFVLTQAEIENLQAYLVKGGAIWGDNALAGSGSRFDVAFRREMKRVVPDKDKNFVPFELSDEMFSQDGHVIKQVPRGMNYYAEMPQHLDIGGKLAILYTPNDYSDLMFMRILPGDKEVYVPNDPPPNTLFTNRGFWEHQDIFYRNFNLDSSLAVNRLGMNVVSYLLTRFDDVLQLNP